VTRLVGALVVLAVLAGCAEDIGHKRINRYAILALAQACEAYNGALRVVTPLRREGHLTPAQIKQVEDSIIATDVPCADKPPADASEALVRVTTAVNTLLQMHPEG
jgi:hypothetical protein